MNDLHTRIRARIKTAKRILITSHVRPDGDAVGSLLGLGLALQDIGKNVQMILSDGIPGSLKHLPGSDQITTAGEGPFDLVICVDCSELKRTGNALGGLVPDLVIDHHATTEPFGTLNLVEADAVATTSVLCRYMNKWGLSINSPIASNLLTGLITDTLGFRTSSTTPEALRQAADLLELGVDMSSLYFNGLVKRTFTGARYWGAGLSNLEQEEGLIWATLTLADREASGYIGNDDADLINILSSIDEAQVALMFVEQSSSKTKVSWRALKEDIDVASLARQFGGGGHRAASGAEIQGAIPDVRARVLAATRIAMKK